MRTSSRSLTYRSYLCSSNRWLHCLLDQSDSRLYSEEPDRQTAGAVQVSAFSIPSSLAIRALLSGFEIRISKKHRILDLEFDKRERETDTFTWSLTEFGFLSLFASIREEEPAKKATPNKKQDKKVRLMIFCLSMFVASNLMLSIWSIWSLTNLKPLSTEKTWFGRASWRLLQTVTERLVHEGDYLQSLQFILILLIILIILIDFSKHP